MRRAVGSVLLAVLVLLFLAAAARSLVPLLQNRVPLAALLGARFPLLVAGLTAGALALGLALVDIVRGRRPRGLRPYRVAFTCVVLVSGLYLWQVLPQRAFYADLAIALAGGAFGVWLAVAGRVRPGRLGRMARPLVLLEFALFNLCLLPVAAEIGLRAASRVSRSPLLVLTDVENEERVAANRLEPGELRFGFPVNSEGYYDDEFPRQPASEPRIAMISDSFGVGTVPHHYHFSTECERRLGVPVDSYGVPSIGPQEYLHLLAAEVLPRSPCLVVVNLFIGNDLMDAHERATRRAGARHRLDRDGLLLFQVAGRLARLRQERQRAGGAGPVGGIRGEGRNFRSDDPAELERELPWLVDPELEQPVLSRETYLEIERRRAAFNLRPGTVHYRPTLDALAELRAVARPTPLVVVLLPDEYQVDDSLWATLEETVAATGVGRFRPQEVLAEWLARNDIPCLDLLPALRDAYRASGQRCYHRHDTHFNASGNRIAGRAMAEFFRPLLPN